MHCDKKYCATTEIMFNTKVHMDIDYDALIMADENDGCACVSHTVNWGGEYESTRPHV